MARDETDARRFLAEGNVFACSQAGHEVELLINNADPGGLRGLRGIDTRGLAIDAHLAGVMGAAEDFDERAAGPVFAEQRQHLAGVQREVHPAKRLHAGKGLLMPRIRSNGGWAASAMDYFSAGS